MNMSPFVSFPLLADDFQEEQIEAAVDEAQDPELPADAEERDSHEQDALIPEDRRAACVIRGCGWRYW